MSQSETDDFNEKWCGKAPCTCVYHAEDGVVCIHDIDLAREAGAVIPDEILALEQAEKAHPHESIGVTYKLSLVG